MCVYVCDHLIEESAIIQSLSRGSPRPTALQHPQSDTFRHVTTLVTIHLWCVHGGGGGGKEGVRE